MKKKNQPSVNPNTLYSAGMVHDKKSIQRLATVQYDVFQIGRKFLFILVGIAMILIGALADLPIQAAGAIVFLGCFCLWFCKAPAQITANRMNAAINGAYPHTQLYFRENEIEITDGKEWFKLPYMGIQRIIQDDKYYYLFLTSSTSYMIDKTMVDPVDLVQFCTFLESHTGLLMEKPITLFRLNISSIIHRMKNAKARKDAKKT